MNVLVLIECLMNCYEMNIDDIEKFVVVIVVGKEVSDIMIEKVMVRVGVILVQFVVLLYMFQQCYEVWQLYYDCLWDVERVKFVVEWIVMKDEVGIFEKMIIDMQVEVWMLWDRILFLSGQIIWLQIEKDDLWCVCDRMFWVIGLLGDWCVIGEFELKLD